MRVVRPARTADIKSLVALAERAGTGLTTLPAHTDTIRRRIDRAYTAFDDALVVPEDGGGHDYFLVMEDLESGEIVGTSALIAGVGLDQPFYNYRLIRLTQRSTQPDLRVDTELLQLSNDFTGSTEVASLFLDRGARGGGAGKLLAKARYMVMAAFPDRFPSRVLAEIRGWVDDHDHSPFWEAIGRHFFGMSFKEADFENGQGNQQFIADLMPKFPIYTALLPQTARDVIGKPHDRALPAVRLLEREGFRFTGGVDIFDGGPAFEASLREIWTVRKSRVATLVGTVERSCTDDDLTHIVSRDGLSNYAATVTKVVDTDSGVFLPSEAARALGVAPGEPIRYCWLDKTEQTQGDAAQSNGGKRRDARDEWGI